MERVETILYITERDAEGGVISHLPYLMLKKEML